MRKQLHRSIIISLLSALFTISISSWSQPIVQLPDGVEAVWDINQAYRLSTPLREKVCINGLWLWRPASSEAEDQPSGDWGYIKVPAPWPGKAGNYMWRETQTAYPHPKWEDENLGAVNRCWYQREISIPADWAGRKISLCVEYLNSYATVYIDGDQLSDIRFPGGEVDITGACTPGKKHVITLLVVAMPLKAIVQSFQDTNNAKQVEGDVPLRGLCGDVYLVSSPKANDIQDVKIETSVRKNEIRLDIALRDAQLHKDFYIRATIFDNNQIVEEFQSELLSTDRLNNKRLSVSHSWKPEKIWDIDSPQNMYQISISLVDENGEEVDRYFPIRFGFREFWIEGRDFVLNGSRIFCFAVPFDNAQVSAAAATYHGALESMRRLKSFGVNAVYTHNYGCEPGVHLGFADILKAADDAGMLVFFSQPHFSAYEWDDPNADSTNGYAQHAEFYVRQAQNHPSVVMYSMSHNATGYSEDMNPDWMDGKHEKRDDWANRNVKKALRAEAIVKQFDQTRIIYHHAGGNLGPMHTSNFYLDFAPIQERSDWFEHWSTDGIKPLFLCEYGAPWGINWTLYRGWYQGKRDFGGAQVPWQFCMAEWNAQFLGDTAYQLNERDKENLRFEDRQAREGKLWHRWDYPSPVIGSYAPENDNQAHVWSMYIKDNWRAFRTWGLSGFNAWNYGKFWELSPNAEKKRKDLAVDWKHLQTPGFSPDFIDQQYERIDTAYEFTDWIPTDAGKALIDNNQPLLAYIAGSANHFTSKNHNFMPGQRIDKQIVLINNSRRTRRADITWSLQLPEPITNNRTIDIKTGEIVKIPVSFDIPRSAEPGAYPVNMSARFDSGPIQKDQFVIHVLRDKASDPFDARIALYDPTGETKQGLDSLGISFQTVNSDTDLEDFDLLIIGKNALTLTDPAPDISRVRDGMKVIVFEQSSSVLEKRLGLRVQEYGLRRVFTRIKDHPALFNIKDEHLHDWNGEATILPPRLEYETRPMYGPIVQWCGIDVPRPWRCGCWGNVASVLIEKPQTGDFIPILDGGFNLQYSPLMEYREGKGLILFCQLDVTGRTEHEPATGILISNILTYVSHYKAPSQKNAIYSGESAGLDYLNKAGFQISLYTGQDLEPDDVLIVGPSGLEAIVDHAAKIRGWLDNGGQVLTIGVTSLKDGFLSNISMKKTEYFNSFFEPFSYDSPFAGIGPSDVLIRSPRQIPLIMDGAIIAANGILAATEKDQIILTQLVPWDFDYQKVFHWKMTYRRASYMLTRLLGNMGVRAGTPLIQRFSMPVVSSQKEDTSSARWLSGFYVDRPEEMDDPYRFFRW
ncbi:MAG: hypothetical protein GC154_18045 [bacterium]|nr:hypothetical protein [bacterium]